MHTKISRTDHIAQRIADTVVRRRWGVILLSLLLVAVI